MLYILLQYILLLSPIPSISLSLSIPLLSFGRPASLPPEAPASASPPGPRARAVPERYRLGVGARRPEERGWGPGSEGVGEESNG